MEANGIRAIWKISVEQVKCETDAGHDFVDCYAACKGDQSCISDCSRELDGKLNSCPCHDGCPAGCPCPDYECPDNECPDGVCPTTTSVIITTAPPSSANSSVLILNTSRVSMSRTRPIITDINGQVDSSNRFEIESDAHAFFSCGVMFKNKFYTYGGELDWEDNFDSMTQISVVEGCSLRKRFYFWHQDHWSQDCSWSHHLHQISLVCLE